MIFAFSFPPCWLILSTADRAQRMIIENQVVRQIPRLQYVKSAIRI